MILSDKTIKELCNNTANQESNFHPLIENFIEKQISEFNNKKIISYGLSSYGYDARLSNEFIIYQDEYKFDAFTAKDNVYNYDYIIDPKKPKEYITKKIITNDPLILAPHGFIMGLTVEKFNIPRDVLAICIGKSTYARCGLVVNVTPVEPGCSGQIVIEISNTTNMPVYLYPNEGICQFIFLKGDNPCATSYKDKGGKYLNQNKIVLPFVF